MFTIFPGSGSSIKNIKVKNTAYRVSLIMIKGSTLSYQKIIITACLLK